jgi:hypothetical protein
MTNAIPIEIADISKALKFLIFGSEEERMKKLLIIMDATNDEITMALAFFPHGETVSFSTHSPFYYIVCIMWELLLSFFIFFDTFYIFFIGIARLMSKIM